MLLMSEKIIMSPALTGQIYPSGKGEDIISQLSQIYTEKHFRKFAHTFVRRHNGKCNNRFSFDEMPTSNFLRGKHIDFNKIKSEVHFGSHWLYIKNLSNDINIRFRDGPTVTLLNKETLATFAGNAFTYPRVNILKEKDTIKPIILIEKIN